MYPGPSSELMIFTGKEKHSPLHLYRFIGRVDWNFISCPRVFRDCTLKDPLIDPWSQTTNTQITNSPLVKAKLARNNSCVWNPFFPHTHTQKPVKKKFRWDPAAIEHPEDIVTYGWWLKSCTTWDVWNPVNNGKNYLSTGAGFQPSTVTTSF